MDLGGGCRWTAVRFGPADSAVVHAPEQKAKTCTVTKVGIDPSCDADSASAVDRFGVLPIPAFPQAGWIESNATPPSAEARVAPGMRPAAEPALAERRPPRHTVNVRFGVIAK